MKRLYLDCGMGAAGDMLTAALLELMPDPDAALAELNAMGIPDVEYRREKSQKCGITGTHITVTVKGREEDEIFSGHDHDHDHDDDHDHHQEHRHDHESHQDSSVHAHHHSGMHDIEEIIGDLHLSSEEKTDALAVYKLIAEAESHVHGVPVTEIHFHEVGTMDAVADVAAVCHLMQALSRPQVIVSPVHVGCGQVQCAHGILPVPAPATAHILRDIPVYGGRIKGELCTPTGAALLKHFASAFGEMPVMRIQKTGYGMGKKDFEAANCVRAFLGESDEGSTGDTVYELSCNLDDMTGEEIGFAEECFFEAGALEVFTIPVGMKKSRPGVLLAVLCPENLKNEMIRLFFKHTTTLGIRESSFRRYTLNRTLETMTAPCGTVRKKVSEGYGVTREKYEFEDLAHISKEKAISLFEAKKQVSASDTEG